MGLSQAFDVAIVGAGAAGAATATLLARAGARVALAARPIAPGRRPVEVCAPATLRLIRQLDLPEPGSAHGARPCRGVLSVWGGIDPQFFDYGLFACGEAAMIDRAAYDAALVASACAAGATLVPVGRGATVERHGRRWSVAGGDARVCSAVFIDASGRSGGIAPRLTARRRFRDRLVAFATSHLQPAGDHTGGDLLLLEAIRGGWWYVSQSAHAHASIVYLSDTDLVPRTDRERRDHLVRAFADTHLIREQIGAIPSFATLGIADARTGRRTRVSGDGWLAIGDAALSIDPLSGDGLRLALASASEAAAAIIANPSGGDAASRRGFALWYRDQRVQQRTYAINAYGAVARRFPTDPFWQRRTPDNSCGVERALSTDGA